MPGAGAGKVTLGIREIAHVLEVSERTVRRMHARGELKTFKVSGPTSPIRIRVADLNKFLNKKKRGKG